ncbi:MAG: TRAP transporter large permease subunit [Spirochaetales bacterium]|nr:TRAP transporter large permease subunit [Spirochaetales bacterium]
MSVTLLFFSNLIVPIITGLFFLLYFIYFIITNPSKAASYKYFVIFLIGFSIFLFGRPLQLMLGPHPLPLIIVNIRVFILCSIISPSIMLAANIFKEKKENNIKRNLIICICVLLGLTYDIFNTLGTNASYILFEFTNITAYDNFTPSLLTPYYGREVTIGVQIITGILLFVFSLFSLIKLAPGIPLKDFIKNKIFLINSGIIIFAISFIIGSIIKQWWIYYVTSIISALLFGGSVLLDIKEVYNYYEKLIPFIKEDIIHNVTFSNFSKIKLMEMLRCLGKKSNLDTFIIIKIKEHYLELTDNLKKIDEIMALCKKHLTNLLNDEDCLLLPLSNNKIGIVLRLLRHTDKQIYILDVLEDIKDEINRKLHCIVTIGIGRSYKKIEDLRVSYYEALNAQGYADQCNTSSVIHVENINESDQHTNKYPVKEKEHLLLLIKAGDIENSKKSLHDFLRRFKLFVGEKPDLNLMIPVQRLVAGSQSFPLLAVPFFIMAGNLMNACGITKRLMKFANTLTGHFRGGLAHVSIVLSTLMGGISGAACADAAMESRILGPAMLKKGYSKGYTAAVIGLSSLITATIPPGIGLILYGFIGEVSIGRLFIAGIIPGLFMALIMMVTASIMARIRKYVPEREKWPSVSELTDSFIDNIWALLFPLILIIGIRFGFFTPSEAGAFAVVYAFIIGKYIYKDLTWKGLFDVLKQTVVDTGIIMLIIMCSSIFGYLIVYDSVPQSIAQAITGLSSSPYIVLFIILGFLFVAGMFMEATVNTLLLTPIFLPIAKQMGFDPVHFGILMMTIITLGSMTPPVGVIMYTVSSLLECPPEKYVLESIPFIMCVLVLVAVLAFFPEVVLFLPKLVYGK